MSWKDKSFKDKFPKDNRYFETDNGILYLGDSIEIMKKFPKESVDLVVTSPPYDNLRTYGSKEELWNFDKFKFIANNLFNIIEKGGVVVWVVGDATINGSETGTSFKQVLFFMECGFNLHDTMIYEKNGSSFPARKDGIRYTQIFEYMFVLSKGKPKNVSLIIDKKNRWEGYTNFGKGTYRDKEGNLKEREMKPVPQFSPRNNIWRYITGKNYSTKDEVAFKHPAIFPDLLAKDHIISWSKKNQIILDPFLGSGTTAVAAERTGRKWIGIEINKDYCEIAKQRILKEVNQKKLNKWFK